MNVIRYFVSRYRAQSLLVLFCILIGGILEGIGLSALIPILGLIFKETQGAPDSAETSALGAAIEKALEAVDLAVS